MSETTTNKKVVSFESLQAASALIATKAEVAKVKAQVDNIESSAVEPSPLTGTQHNRGAVYPSPSISRNKKLGGIIHAYSREKHFL